MESVYLYNSTNYYMLEHENASRRRLIEQFYRNRNIDDPAYYILIAVYGFLILFGSTGNVLVVLAVLRNKQMQTARNIFIVNLAVSDLLLCLVTMPLTLVEVLSKYWPLGDSALLCKTIGALQAISIFVSTISITAIALDRYQVIVGCPAKDNLQMLGAVLALTLIWTIALFCAAPLFIFRNLIHYNINSKELNIDTISYCIEDWPEMPIFNGRVYYSLFSLAFQYVIPILIVTSAYLRIYMRLKKRFIIPQTIPNVDERIQNRRGRRMKRTNCLLISIALIFGISWLPLNFFNLFADLYFTPNNIKLTQTIYIIYAACHMVGMSSACSNPLLYGWLNDNFRKEFNEILCCSKIDNDSTTIKLREIDASCALSRRTLFEPSSRQKSGIDNMKVSSKEELHDFKSEFTVTSNI